MIKKLLSIHILALTLTFSGNIFADQDKSTESLLAQLEYQRSKLTNEDTSHQERLAKIDEYYDMSIAQLDSFIASKRGREAKLHTMNMTTIGALQVSSSQKSELTTTETQRNYAVSQEINAEDTQRRLDILAEYNRKKDRANTNNEKTVNHISSIIEKLEAKLNTQP